MGVIAFTWKFGVISMLIINQSFRSKRATWGHLWRPREEQTECQLCCEQRWEGRKQERPEMLDHVQRCRSVRVQLRRSRWIHNVSRENWMVRPKLDHWPMATAGRIHLFQVHADIRRGAYRERWPAGRQRMPSLEAREPSTNRNELWRCIWAGVRD